MYTHTNKDTHKQRHTQTKTHKIYTYIHTYTLGEAGSMPSSVLNELRLPSSVRIAPGWMETEVGREAATLRFGDFSWRGGESFCACLYVVVCAYET